MNHREGRLHIAVGVVFNTAGDKVLVSRRPPHASHGGLWEFPGGKCREREPVEQALRRELMEELGLEVQRAKPLLCLDHEYPDGAVSLDVWVVEKWSGRVSGMEGQQVEWMPVSALRDLEFPAANRHIITSLMLPRLYVITPDLEEYNSDFLALTRQLLRAGLGLLQFRCTRLDERSRAGVIAPLSELCREHGCRLIINGSPTESVKFDAAGVHLSSARLLQLNERPLDRQYLVGASCHNSMELQHAARLGADFAVLGPVQETATHPEVEPLGWDSFRELVRSARIPVYALGGMRVADLNAVLQSGAQGIAMIRGVWAAEDPAAVVESCATPGISVS